MSVNLQPNARSSLYELQSESALAVTKHPFTLMSNDAAVYKIQPGDTVGYKAQIQDCVFFLNDQEIVFVAGRHLVLQQLQSRRKKVLTLFPISDDKPNNNIGIVTAFSVDRRRKLLGIAREPSGDGKAQLILYRIQNLANKKTPPSESDVVSSSSVSVANVIPHPGLAALQCLAFSHDSSLIACLSAAEPVSTVFIWDWARTRKVAALEVRMKLSRLEFNPLDKTQVSSSGPTHLRLWTIADKTLKPLSVGVSKADGFSEHCWLTNDRILAATTKGDLFNLRDGTILDKFTRLFKDDTIHCIAPCTSGVIVGGTNGWVSVFTDNANMNLTLLHQVQLNPSSLATIRHVALDASQSTALVCGKNFIECYRMPTVHEFLLKGEEEDRMRSHRLFGLPAGEICSLSVCTRKPLVVTCGTYHAFTSLSVWNYVSKESILTEKFHHLVPLSADVHPSGYQLLVVFSNRVRLYHLLHDGMKLACEIPLQRTTNATFNYGGDKFAVVCEKSIRVYNTFGGRGGCNPQLIGIFSGHAACISCFCWSRDGLTLYSGDVGGSVYQWALADISAGRRALEFTDSRRVCTMIATAEDGTVAVSTTSSATERHSVLLWRAFASNSAGESSGIQHADDFDLKIDMPASTRATSVALASGNNIVYVGTSDGCVLQYDTTEGAAFHNKYELHDKDVKALVLSMDEKTLVTGSSDGSIFLSDIIDQSAGGTEDSITGPSFLPFEQDVCLLLKSDLEVYENRIAEISVERDEIVAKNAFAQTQAISQHATEIQELSTRFATLEQDNQRQTYRYEQDIQELQDNSRRQLENERKENAATTLAMESLYEAKLSASNATIAQLKGQIDELKLDKRDVEFAGEEKLVSLKSELTDRFRDELGRLKDENARLRESRYQQKLQYEAMLAQQDQDHMTQLNKMHADQEQIKLRGEEKVHASKNETSSLQQKIRMLYQALQDKESVVSQAEDQAAAARHDLQHAQQVIEDLNGDLAKAKVLQANMGQKEHEYESRILNLERNCRVSDHQLSTLKKQMQPKDRALADLSMQLDELHAENERGVGAANELDQQVEENLRKLRVLELTIKKDETEIHSLKAFIASFSRELDDVVHHFAASSTSTSVVAMKNQIFELHEKYVASRDGVAETIQSKRFSNKTTLREMAKQNEVMNSSMKGIRKRLFLETKKREAMVRRSVKQSAMVVEEMNELRKKNHELQLEIQRLQSGAVQRPAAAAGQHSASIRTAGARPIAAKPRPQSTPTKRRRPGTAVGPRTTTTEAAAGIQPRFSTTYTIKHTGLKASMRPKTAARIRSNQEHK